MFLQEEFGCSHFLLTNKVFSCLATSPSSWRPALPACSLLERRETSSQALSRWGTLVSWSSTNQGGPRRCPRKAHFWTCKIRMKQWKTFFTYLSSAFMGSSSLLSSSDSSKSNSLLLGLLFTSSAGMLGFAKKDISLWSLAKTRSRSCLLIIFRSFHRGSSAFWTIRVKPINRD